MIDITKSRLVPKDVTTPKLVNKDGAINIEVLLRELETNPPKDMELTIKLNEIFNMDDSDFLKKIFLQAEACVNHWGNEGYKDYKEYREDAVKNYLDKFAEVNWRDIARLYQLPESMINPIEFEPKQLAIRHLALCGSRKYSSKDLQKIAEGLDDYLNGRGKWSRFICNSQEIVSEFLSGVKRGAGKLIKISLIGVGALAIGAVGMLYLNIITFPAHTKDVHIPGLGRVQISPYDPNKPKPQIIDQNEVILDNDINKPSLDSKILYRTKTAPNRYDLIVDNYIVDVPEFGERLFGSVICQNSESLQSICTRLPSLNLNENDLWKLIDDKRYDKIIPALQEKYEIPVSDTFIFFELPKEITDQVVGDSSLRDIDGHKVNIYKDINKNQDMACIILKPAEKLEHIIQRFPSLKLIPNNFYCNLDLRHPLEKISPQSDESKLEGRRIFFYLPK